MSTKLNVGFLGAVKANVSAALLTVGTFIAKVAAITVRAPKHEDADFDFSEEFEQVGISFESVGRDGKKGRATAYISFQGFVNYDDINTDAKAAPFVANLTAKDLGVTTGEFKTMKPLAKFRAMYFKSQLTGDAVNRRTKQRLSDMILDENGAPVHADDQGANTKAAMEIATKVVSRLGLTMEELLSFDPNSTQLYAKIVVDSKTYRDKEKITVTVKESATEEQYQEHLDKYSEA